jgi:hypothetical protein
MTLNFMKFHTRGSRVQRFRVQRFKGSEVLGFRGSGVQRFKGSRVYFKANIE